MSQMCFHFLLLGKHFEKMYLSLIFRYQQHIVIFCVPCCLVPYVQFKIKCVIYKCYEMCVQYNLPDKHFRNGKLILTELFSSIPNHFE